MPVLPTSLATFLFLATMGPAAAGAQSSTQGSAQNSAQSSIQSAATAATAAPGVASGTFKVIPAIRANAALRSGLFVSCTVGRDCAEETVDGRKFYVLETEAMIVKASAEPDARFNRIAVSVQNRASFPVRVSPSDFRIEASEPKFRRFSYVDPAGLKLSVPRPAPVLGSSFVGGAHPSHGEPGRGVFLPATELATHETTSGEVLFERSSGAATMSLLLPISGSIFEFTYRVAK